jgi:hypothetical protein
MNFEDSGFALDKILINSDKLKEISTNIYQINDVNRYIICKPSGYLSGDFRFLSYIWYLVYTYNERNKLIFSIRKFYKLKNDPSNRKFVVIYSYNTETRETKRFQCYTSISDGSFWRLCIKDDSIERFDKGYNYISSTFININLQQFIDKFLYIFEEIQYEESNIQCENKSSLSEYLKERVFTTKYISGNEIFVAFNEIFPVVLYLEKYNDCLIMLLENLLNFTRENNSVKIDIYSEIYFALKKNNVNKKFNLTDETSRREFYKKVNKAISEVFLNNFVIVESSKKKCYEKKFKVGEIEYRADIYTIDIIYKHIYGKIYKMCYMIYQASGKTYKNIIHIIPKPNKINQYGLDERYVATGAFVNKIFDYPPQAPITVFGHIPERRSLGYRFIGDLTNYDFLPN